jgi:hypothetical protein
MLTPTEHRPFIARVFGRAALAMGCVGAVAAAATFVYVLLVGTGSESAACVSVFTAGALVLAVLGVPCGLYSLWLSRTGLGWLGLALCVAPVLVSVPLAFMAGGAHR